MKTSAPSIDYSTQPSVELLAACPCAMYPVAHLHNHYDRISAVRRWNAVAKNKLKEPAK